MTGQQSGHAAVGGPITVLVIDDDPSVFETTRFALIGMKIDGRPLRLLSAGSAAAGYEVLAGEAVDVAIIDVEMETATAGLALIDRLARSAQFDGVGIIVRTGRPELASEDSVRVDPRIADYLLKSDVTRDRLRQAIATALRTQS